VAGWRITKWRLNAGVIKMKMNREKDCDICDCKLFEVKVGVAKIPFLKRLHETYGEYCCECGQLLYAEVRPV